MRILIVTNHFQPEEFRINDIARDLSVRGHEITVITGMPDYPLGKIFPGYGLFQRRVEVVDGITIQRVPVFPRGNGPLSRLLLNYLSYAVFSCLLAPWYGRRRHDVIFVFETSPITVCLPAIIVKKLKSIPLVLWVLDLWPESMSATGYVRSSGMVGLVGRLVRFIYRYCDYILVSSKGFIRSTRAMGVEQERLAYFPNWCERGYEPAAYRNDATLPAFPDGFVVLFAGNIGVAQGFETILDAAEKLRDHGRIHWVIIGDGRKFIWVKEEVVKRGLTGNFHVLGHYPAETMPYFFSQASALLVSLKKDPLFSLTVPGKVQSYMVSGKPLVAALDGEGANLVEEAGCGMVSPADDANALAEVVLKMSELPEARLREMGACGQEYSKKHFDRKLLIDELETLLQRFADSGKE
jgi:glycosyltransferase involved in cell wall biosynthesis